MVAVRRPVAALLGPDHDHRVEKPSQPVDGARQSGHVCLREIALVRRGVDFFQRERGEQLPVPA